MEASVERVGLKVDEIIPHGGGGALYNGTVRFKVRTHAIEFEYAYDFRLSLSVEQAIRLGAQNIKCELNALIDAIDAGLNKDSLF